MPHNASVMSSARRTLQTKAGEVRLRVPKLRRQAFETAIIERYRRRESSVEEALIEMYLAGVGNCILARAPIRPNSAWKALGVIGPSRSIIK